MKYFSALEVMFGDRNLKDMPVFTAYVRADTLACKDEVFSIWVLSVNKQKVTVESAGAKDGTWI